MRSMIEKEPSRIIFNSRSSIEQREILAASDTRMNHKSLFAFIFSFALLPIATAQDSGSSYWFRHAAISPDGNSIAFSHQGDVFVVDSKGGLARALTTSDAWDGHPVWSRDGKQIAFASDRHGNLDVFLMPAEGGKATRLTHHSSNDIPADFSVGGDAVLFSSARGDSAEASIFPTSRLAELYEVRTDGGTPRRISTIPASQARYTDDGKGIVYRDEKAYEKVELLNFDTLVRSLML